MDESDRLRLFALNGLRGFGLGENFAPGFFHADEVGAMPAAHFRDTLGEITGGENQEFGAGIDEIRNGGLHARAAGTGKSMHELILGAEQVAQRGADVFELLKQEWIQVADDGLCHRLINAFGNLGRTGSEQEPGRGRENGHGDSLPRAGQCMRDDGVRDA